MNTITKWFSNDREIINIENKLKSLKHYNKLLLKYAKNKENAIKLIEFLSGDLAQHMYAQVNHEYPLKKNVNLSLIGQSFGKMQEGITKGSFKQDLVSLPKLGNLREKAIKVMQRAGFN